MIQAYRIAKWSEVFERAESRKLKTLTWVAMPVGFQSTGYQSMLDEFEDQAPAVYGAWCALVSLAASCHVRGLLTNGRGEPLKLSHIARITGFPKEIFDKLFHWAASPSVRWLEAVEPVEVDAAMATNGDDDSSSGESPDDLPAVQGNPPSTQPNLTIPNPTQPDITQQDTTQPNPTEPTAAGGRAAGGWSLMKVDSDECLRACQRLRKALCKRHHDVDEATVWRWGWLSMAFDQGHLLPELADRLHCNQVKRPAAYIDKALRRISNERGLELSEAAAAIPPMPMNRTFTEDEIKAARYRVFKPLRESLGRAPTDAEVHEAVMADLEGRKRHRAEPCEV